jgi:hypothetical protein
MRFIGRISMAGVLLGAVLALSGLAVSSASAALPKGLCWKVEFKETGNYNEGCLKEVGLLDGTYVLAELEEEQGYHLYCAKIDGGLETGSSEGAKCVKLAPHTNGKWTTVLFGLPTLLLLTGGKLPVETKGESKTFVTKLETKLGSLEGEGILVQLHWTNLNSGSLGPASLLFTKVKEPVGGKPTCSTTGDSTGLVLIDDAEWHLVYILLDPLQVGILFLIPQFTITCGAVSEKVKGSSIATVTPIGKEVGTTESFDSVSACLANLKPGVTKYWNDEGAEVTAKLEAELNGLGKFEEACENVAGEVLLFPTEMIEISEP